MEVALRGDEVGEYSLFIIRLLVGVEDLLDDLPPVQLIAHIVLALLAQFINTHCRDAILTKILEEALDFEVRINSIVLYYRVRVNCIFGEFILIVYYKGGVHCESTDELVFHAPLVH